MLNGEGAVNTGGTLRSWQFSKNICVGQLSVSDPKLSENFFFHFFGGFDLRLPSIRLLGVFLAVDLLCGLIQFDV